MHNITYKKKAKQSFYLNVKCFKICFFLSLYNIISFLVTMTINSLPQQAINVHPSVGTALLNAHSKETKLFRPSTMRSITLSNRIIVSPMCMYSSENDYFNDFHVAHYDSFAIKGAGMVFIEASAVELNGRITPEDAGIWCDTHIPVLRQITTLIKSQGSVPALQIGHAGRKASVYSPFHELSGLLLTKEFGGWPDQVIGPSAIALSQDYTVPKEMTEQDMSRVTEKFIEASIRADKAGVEVLKIHSAHGCLIHSFLSGNSNQRTDQYGGSLENRMRFPLKIIQCVRDTWPQHKPLWVRISASDHKNDHGDMGGEDNDGWDINQSVIYARELNKIGVDVIDVSSGGNLAIADYSAGPL